MKLIIIHQYDPTVHHVGGIKTFINAFVHNAPEDVEIQLVGVTAQPERYPVGKWHPVATGEKSFRFFPILEANPIKVTSIPLSLRMVLALFRYRRKINTQDAVLCFHRIEPMMSFLRDRSPKFLFLHGHNMKDFYNKQTEIRWGKLPWLYFWLERILLPMADHTYIVREDAVRDYQKQYSTKANSISFIPTWADENIFHPVSAGERQDLRMRLFKKLGLSPSIKSFLFVGRYVGQKDPLRLLRAFKLVHSQCPDSTLIMIGEGNLKKDMQDYLEQHNLSSAVHLLPPMSQDHVGQWMNSADVLCLSSAFEGMPCVVVEALHCGLPVVSTAVGEAGRLIGDSLGGRLVSQEGDEAFAKAMIDLVENPPSSDSCKSQVSDFTARKILEPVFNKFRKISRDK